MEWVNAYVSDSNLVLLRREGDNLVRHVQRAEFSAFYKVEDLGEMEKKLRSSRNVREVVDEPGGFVRVCFVSQEARRLLVHGTREKPSPLSGIPVYEGDVHPIARHFAESGDTIQLPRVVHVDLETDSRVPFARKEDGRTLSWCLVDAHENVVGEGMLDHDTDADEKRLYEELFEALRPFDLVSAWNGDGFDFPVIAARASKRRVRADLRNWLWMDYMELFKRMNTASESGDEKASMRLGDVASRIVGETKDDFDASKTWEEWEAGGERRARMGRYNRQDTVLLPKLEKKTGFLALQFTLSEVCNVLPDTSGLNPIPQMDGFMFKLAKEQGRGMRFGTKHYYSGTPDKYEGAYVMTPEAKGIEKNVHVCDFKSLYPSIIRTWNMSPDTLRRGPINGPIAEGMCRAYSGVTFDAGEDGMLPAALRKLMDMRVEWANKKKKEPPATPAWYDANRRSTAYKVAANSFYGAMGSVYSRFFDKRIAESVTKCGKWLILETIAAAKKRLVDPNSKEEHPERWRAIYADTDSVFVTGPTEEEFGDFVKWCNTDFYPHLLTQEGCGHRSVISLAFEKTFARVVFSGKKRYFGSYAHFDGARATADSKPEVRGLEFRRGDTILLARRLQEEVINLVLAGHEDVAPFVAVVEKYLAKILQGDLALDEIVMSKGLSKGLDAYVTKAKKDGSEGAGLVHVNVAKQMAERGMEVREGTKIPFIVTDEGPPQKAIWAGDYTGIEADRYFIWETQVYPATQRVLEAAFPDNPLWALFEKQRPKRMRGQAKNNLDLFSFESQKLRSDFYAKQEKEVEEPSMPRQMISKPKTEPTTPAEADPRQTTIDDVIGPELTKENADKALDAAKKTRQGDAVAKLEELKKLQSVLNQRPDASPGKQTKADADPVPKSVEQSQMAADELEEFAGESANQQARGGGIEAISRLVFIEGDSMEAMYKELEAALVMVEGLHEHGNIAEALNESEMHFRNAHRLFVTARLGRKSRDLTDASVRSKLRDDAQRILNKEYDEKKRSKPTIADIEAAMMNLFTDEMTALEDRSLRWNLTEDSLENLVRAWESRCRTLQALLQRSR